MEFVEEIEEAECEHCAWLCKSCRKPANPKKLDTMGNMGVAIAVSDADCCGAGNIKKSKLDGAGWHCTRFSNAVTKLVGGTKVK